MCPYMYTAFGCGITLLIVPMLFPTLDPQPVLVNCICVCTYVLLLCTSSLYLPVLTAYSGTAPGDSKIGYSILVMGHTGAQVVEFVLPEFIYPERNLYIILVVTIVAVPLFTVADIHYGSGTSRNICGKKKPVVVKNEDTQCEPVTTSKEKGMYAQDIVYNSVC